MSFLKTTKFWTIVAGVIGVLGFCLGAYVFYIDQWIRPKALTVELTSVSTLLNEKVRSNGKGLRILFGDEPVANFAIAQVRVVNTGGSPILTADFEGHLAVFMKNVGKIYFIEVKTPAPIDLSPIVNLADRASFRVSPLLLNPGDEFIVEVGIDSLSETELPEISTIGRIAGISRISSQGTIARQGAHWGWHLLVGLLGGLAGLLTGERIGRIHGRYTARMREENLHKRRIDGSD